jgi:hypothetical protein
MQIYGSATAQEHYQTHEGKGGEIDIGFLVTSAILNTFVTLYLLYYLLQVRFDKHTDYFNIVAGLLLIGGLCADIFLGVFIVDIANNSPEKAQNASYGWIYGIGSFNFIVRMFYIIQFQCSDILARRVVKPVAPTITEQVKRAFLPGNSGPSQQGPRPDRGPNPFVKTEEGGRRRRRR